MVQAKNLANLARILIMMKVDTLSSWW